MLQAKRASRPTGLATSVPGRRAAGPEPPAPGLLVAAAPRYRAAAVPVLRVMYKNQPERSILFIAPDCNSAACTKTAIEVHSCT